MMVQCQQPGCPGSILDGYCDTCGMPGQQPEAVVTMPPPAQPEPARAMPAEPQHAMSAPAAPVIPAPPSPTSPPMAPLPSAPRPAPRVIIPTECREPGCTGTIVDGYCDTCGMPGGNSEVRYVVVHDDAPEPVVTAPPPSQSAPPHVVAQPGSSAPAPAAVPTPAPRQSQPPSRPQARSGGPCTQPGCQGRIVDGYCDTCGAPAGAAPLASSPAQVDSLPTAHPTHTMRSTALGSARAAAGSKRRRNAMARLRSARIGAGLTTVPPAPPVDPHTELMKDPVVPENKRNCPACGHAVGRSRGDVPSRTTGYCPHCGTRFDFDPKLVRGDLVAHQYEVEGALAHGGMGWLYLARDRNVSDRWVVLKGLLNSEDPDLIKATISEQRFLAQVQHPLIVEIFNFVTHEGVGYIVMEYVGGRSLKQLLKERMTATPGRYNPLPVDQALAFIIEALPAFSYLHEMGLVYCDFKPDNIIQVGDSLKMIDLGGVRRMDDNDSAIFGTVGYQAPEVASQGCSVASDLYTIGRSLVVLCAEFRGYQTTYAHSIPTPAEMPLFAEHDSLYRVILKCCAPDPNDRFLSAEELRLQLLGVLREEVAATLHGTSRTSATSLLFDPPSVSSDSFDWHELPELRADATDPMFAFLATVNADDPRVRLLALNKPPTETAEVIIARCRAALELNDQQTLAAQVERLLGQDPWEWRAVWMQGMGALLAGNWASAQSCFNAVYGQVPGELAPKLALAVACEHGTEPDVAETLYTVCASTDANYVTPAGFGLARIRAARGDLPGALAALDMIPTTSRGFYESRKLRVQHLVTMARGLEDLATAMRNLSDSHLSEETRDQFRVDILRQALALVEKDGPKPSIIIGSTEADQAGLRFQLEAAYRHLAQRTGDHRTRVALIDNANRTRRWTLL